MLKVLFLVFSVLSLHAMANQVVIHVPGMVCQMCVQGMQKSFREVVEDTRKDVVVDLNKKTVSLTLKNKISDDEIKRRINDAGYNASKIVWSERKKKK